METFTVAVAVCGNSVAGFSGFTDLLTVVGIALFFGFLYPSSVAASRVARRERLRNRLAPA